MWDYTTPQRDGAFDASIVIHECTHGVSNRLTGGPQNTKCLETLEAGGMGEGWSDSFANAVKMKANYTRDFACPMSPCIVNNASGIRTYPYSTN